MFEKGVTLLMKGKGFALDDSSTNTLQGKFQLYIKARDEDDLNPNDDRDFFFINMNLEVSEHYTAAMDFTGENNNVRLTMSFRIVCEQNYYGGNCTVYCEAQDDNETGHYLCNRDGSFQCLEGFENPENHCKDGQLSSPQFLLQRGVIGYRCRQLYDLPCRGPKGYEV